MYTHGEIEVILLTPFQGYNQMYIWKVAYFPFGATPEDPYPVEMSVANLIVRVSEINS